MPDQGRNHLILRVASLVLLVFLGLVAPVDRAYSTDSASTPIKLGVLAKRGPLPAFKKWSALTTYLSGEIGRDVQLVPLGFSQLLEYVAQGKLDLILCNQVFYVLLNRQYDVKALATLANRRAGPYMGGVIFVRKDSSIKALSELTGKRITVVSKRSAGGYLMQAAMLLKKGIDIRQASSIKPLSNQDYVVYSVLNQAADAGFVRTDQLESMAREGKIQLEDFRVLNPQKHPDFPFLCSTPLWPAWPLSSMPSVNEALQAKIKKALLAMPADSTAARNAGLKGFVQAGDYSPVKEAMMALGLP